MKRKIVKHGTSTLTVSLPNKWARAHNLSQGDELEIAEKSNMLIIGQDLGPASRSMEIDLSKTGNMLHRVIAALYKSGFDKLIIKFETPEELEKIQATVYKFCHVYEIISISKNKIEIKAISQLKPLHFESMTRRMINSIMNIAHGTLNGIKKNDHNELSQMILKDQLVDRYCAYGSRIISKGWQLDYPAGPMYLIFDQTEIAADIFKTISTEAMKENCVEEPNIRLLEEIIKMMELQFCMIKSFNIHKIRELEKMEQGIRNHILNTKTKNCIIFACLVNLFETVFEMKSAIMVLNFSQQ